MTTSRFRIILAGIWMSALFWPYAHAGGYLAPDFLGLTPFFLSLAELWQTWPLKWLIWIGTLFAELYVQWSTLPGPRQFFQSVIRSMVALHRIAPSEWNQISAHLATPLILFGAALGWMVYRQTTTKTRTLALFGVGVTALALNHVLWGLNAETPLFVYLAVGLLLLVWFQGFYPTRGDMTFHPHRLWYLLATFAVTLPLAVGWSTTPHRSHGYLSIGIGQPTRLGDGSSGSAKTGFSSGVNHIGHSLIPSYRPVMLIHSPTPHYWQAEIYTQFNGKVWTNPTSAAPFTINQNYNMPLFPLPFSGRVSTTTQTFHVTSSGRPLNTLFYAGTPTAVKASHPITVYPSHEELVGSNVTSYSITAVIPSFNFSKIAAAPYPTGTAMPQDLQIPNNLSPKVKALATKITQHTTTPWQAVKAIQTYLDRHYRYSYKVTPTHTNVVNHFLFKNRQGYCDQFSTSFIMMLRTLGIPARWVVGFGPGTFSATKNAYVIRAVDAHSWAEVYVSPYGWIPIDPTPGWSIPDLSSGSNASSTQPQEQTSLPKNPKVPNSPKPQVHLKGPSRTSITAHPHKHPKVNVLTAWHMIWAALILLILLLISLGFSRFRHRSSSIQTWGSMQRWLWIHQRISLKTIETPRQFAAIWVTRYASDPKALFEMIRLAERALYGHQELSPSEISRWQSLWQTVRETRHTQSQFTA